MSIADKVKSWGEHLDKKMNAPLPHGAKGKALEMKKTESPRAREIRENNERSKNNSLKMIAQRKHEGRNKTSLHERREWMKTMSKDN